MLHIWHIKRVLKKKLIFTTSIVYILYYLNNYDFYKMNSNKDILDKALGRPAMMAFLILVGTYITTGQLVPGVF